MQLLVSSKFRQLCIDSLTRSVAINPSFRSTMLQHSQFAAHCKDSQSTSFASSCNLLLFFSTHLRPRQLMEHSAMMSLSHQKLADQEVSRCLETPQCPCSQCKMEAAFGGFSVTDFHAKSEQPLRKHLSQSPKIAYTPDGHRCKKFPCPVCNPGRSQRDGISTQMLESYAHGAEQQLLRHGRHQAGVILFGDGGHTCRKFPCPVCHNGRSAALAVEVGC